METITERVMHYTRRVGASVTCLACGGKGYIVARFFDGTPYPMTCKGCNGTGTQMIRGQ